VIGDEAQAEIGFRDFSYSVLSRWFNVGCRSLRTALVADFGADEKSVAGLVGGGPSVLPHSHDEDNVSDGVMKVSLVMKVSNIKTSAQTKFVCKTCNPSQLWTPS
jgi:hypothetical protein